MILGKVRSWLIAALLVCNACVEGTDPRLVREVLGGAFTEFAEGYVRNILWNDPGHQVQGPIFAIGEELIEAEYKADIFVKEDAKNNVVDPIIYRFKNRHSYIVKGSKKRAPEELEVSSSILAKLDAGYDNTHMHIIAPEYYAVVTPGMPMQIKSVRSYRRGDIHHGSWVLSIMVEAQGIRVSQLDDNQFLEAYETLIPSIKIMHSLGIIHGDLHSGNMFFCPATKKMSLIDVGDSPDEKKSPALAKDDIMYTAAALFTRFCFSEARCMKIIEGYFAQLSGRQMACLDRYYNFVLTTYEHREIDTPSWFSLIKKIDSRVGKYMKKYDNEEFVPEYVLDGLSDFAETLDIFFKYAPKVEKLLCKSTTIRHKLMTSLLCKSTTIRHKLMTSLLCKSTTIRQIAVKLSEES